MISVHKFWFFALYPSGNTFASGKPPGLLGRIETTSNASNLTVCACLSEAFAAGVAAFTEAIKVGEMTDVHATVRSKSLLRKFSWNGGSPVREGGA